MTAPDYESRIERARVAAELAPACTEPDVTDLLASLPDPAYPPALLAARRAEFVRQIAERNERAILDSRLDEIAASLPTVDPETRRELEGEAADILTKIERM